MYLGSDLVQQCIVKVTMTTSRGSLTTRQGETLTANLLPDISKKQPKKAMGSAPILGQCWKTKANIQKKHTNKVLLTAESLSWGVYQQNKANQEEKGHGFHHTGGRTTTPLIKHNYTRHSTNTCSVAFHHFQCQKRQTSFYVSALFFIICYNTAWVEASRGVLVSLCCLWNLKNSKLLFSSHP